MAKTAEDTWIEGLKDVVAAVRTTPGYQQADMFTKFSALIGSSKIVANKINALKGLLEIVQDDENADAYFEDVKTLMPNLRAVINDAYAGGALSEETQEAVRAATKVLNAFIDAELIDDADAPLIVKDLLAAVSNTADVTVATKLALTVAMCEILRHFALDLAKSEPALLGTLGQTAMKMLQDPAAQGANPDDENSLDKAAFTILETLGDHAPADLAVAPLMQAALQATASGEATQQVSGYLTLYVIATVGVKADATDAKGGKAAQDVMEAVIKGIQDEKNADVRAAAFQALTHVATIERVPYAAYYDALFAALHKQLQECPTDKTGQLALTWACEAAEALVEVEEGRSFLTEQQKYVEDLLKALLAVANHADFPDSVKRHALEAVAAVGRNMGRAVNSKQKKGAKKAATEGVDEHGNLEEKKAPETTKPAKKGKPKAKGKPKKGGRRKDSDDDSDDSDESDEDDEEEGSASKATPAASAADVTRGVGNPKFAPFFEETMKLAKSAVESKDQKVKDSGLRALGGAARAGGKELFRPHLQYAVDTIFSSVEDEASVPLVRSHAYLLFNALTDIYGPSEPVLAEKLDEFIQAITGPLDPMWGLKPEAGATKEKEECGHAHGPGEHGHSHGAGAGGHGHSHGGDDEDEGEGDGEGTMMTFQVDNERMDEQTTALECLRDMMSLWGPAMMEHVNDWLVPILESLSSPGPNSQAQLTLLEVVAEIPAALPPHPEGTSATDSKAKKVINNVLPPLMEYLNGTDGEMVAATVRALGQILKYAGPALAGQLMKVLGRFLNDAINCNTPVQRAMKDDFPDDEDEDEDEDDEDEDEDERPMRRGRGKAKPQPKKGKGKKKADSDEDEDDSEDEKPKKKDDEKKAETDEDPDAVLVDALDLISDLSKVLGTKFEASFKTFLPTLIKLCKQPKTAFMSIGTIGEVLDNIGTAASSYVAKVSPLVLEGLKSSNIDFARNAAFTAGVLALRGGEKAVALYPQLIEALTPHLKRDPTTEESKKWNSSSYYHYGAVVSELRENAASAVAKMILVSPQSLDLKTTVPLLLNCCPLTDDLSESLFVYSCLVKMVNQFPSTFPGVVEPHLPQIKSIFDSVIANTDPAMPEKVKKFVQATRAKMA